MNPNTPQPSFELPTPHPEQGMGTPLAEQVAAQPETFKQPPVAQPAPVPQPQAAQPVPFQPSVPPGVPPQPAPTHSASPTIADDADLIEKEWVIRAKQIVAATREDPHLQSKEMSRFKADYLKKRYNKDIKTEES